MLEPKHATNIQPPKRGSLASFALEKIEAYADGLAERIYPDDKRWYALPGIEVLPQEIAWLLAKAFTPAGFRYTDKAHFLRDSGRIEPELHHALVHWEWMDDYGDELFTECCRIAPIAIALWKEARSLEVQAKVEADAGTPHAGSSSSDTQQAPAEEKVERHEESISEWVLL